ncbi:MAG TPA: M56 family metallopeptidase, partial [Thermomonas sp.]|nr:M56 family metallopeptidase [Thermomonas sp.]
MHDLPAILVPALGTALLQFLWQGALVGALAWAALALLGNARPQARYAVACLALLACVAIPAWTLLSALPGAPAGASPGAALVAPAATPAGFVLAPADLPLLDALRRGGGALAPWLVALWAAGAATLLLRMACGLAWVHALRMQPQAGDARAWQDRLQRLGGRLGLRRAVALRLSADGDSPLTIGWWKPVVLVPAAIAANMPAPLLEALLAHELAHIRRHDYLVNLLQGVVEALLFYHPVVWWLSHRIR